MGNCSTYAHINHIRTDHSKPVSRPHPARRHPLTTAHKETQRQEGRRKKQIQGQEGQHMAELQRVQSPILQPVATEPVQPTRQHVLWPSTTATDTTISSVPTCPPTPCQHDYNLQLVQQRERQRQTERQVQQPAQRIQGPRQEQIGTAQHGDCSDSDS